MTYFLERIAQHLYSQTNGNITNHCLVFPSRRAGLYFLKYYSALLDKPVWSPVIMTVNEFMGSFSDLVVPDDERLLFELYTVYRKLNKQAENFDEFYFWGSMLVNDFDDIDKYMADAQVIFRNVNDFKNIDSQFGDINQEQAEIIKKFWKNYEPDKHSPQKEGFISVWSILGDLYNNYKIMLRSRQMAYEGMILREVAEKFLNSNHCGLKWTKVHFIGFNALNNCELTVMKKLQDDDRACFYWDYDNTYIRDGKLNSAGMFMNRNLEIFRNDMPEDWCYDTLLTRKDSALTRNIIETTSDIAQVKLIPELIYKISGLSPSDAHHTAIILADENLVVPILTSLPDNIGDINITMGFPLGMTDVYNLMKFIFRLQRNLLVEGGNIYFGNQEVVEILRHKLVERVTGEEENKVLDEINEKGLFNIPSDSLSRTELMKVIFRKPADPVNFSEYLKEILTIVSLVNINENDSSSDQIINWKIQNEFIHTVLNSVNRLESLIRLPDISFSNETYMRILEKILIKQSAAFTGEPLSGIQIMGFLETRALDFRNIIMLSVNEGSLPAESSGSSFIPLSIREAFGLPVVNHQESIYAYHFFRLLHRAQNVNFIYNSDSTGLRSGEISRFITQMKYEQIIDPSVFNLKFDIVTGSSIRPEIEKSSWHLERLHSRYAGTEGNEVKAIISPTAVNTWLECRMKFYYRYVSNLKEPGIKSPEIDHAVFGQILHGMMRKIYIDLLGREISQNFIESLTKEDKYIRNIIDQSVNESFAIDGLRRTSGNNLIIKEILFTYLKLIMDADREIAPFTIIELEKQLSFNLEVACDGKEYVFRTGGTIDRLDRVEGVTRVVDYKTGDTVRKISSTEDLFADDRKKDLDGWLQTLLYCEAWFAHNKTGSVRPSIYRVKKLTAERFSDTLKIGEGRAGELTVNDYQVVRESYLSGLKGVISSIFSIDEPFRMTTHLSKCRYCLYSGLCQR
jgi:hypothetical protein